MLYLTTFAAFKRYQLLDAGFAFAVMGMVCALSTALALLQNLRAMAIIGFTGGLLVLVLLSTSGGSHIALFSYHALKNIAVLAIAWFKTWRLLTVSSFVLIFGIAGLWARDHYEVIHYNYILWGLLLLGVAVLAAMAWGTVRQLRTTIT